MEDQEIVELYFRRDEQAMGAVINKYARLLWPMDRTVIP